MDTAGPRVGTYPSDGTDVVEVIHAKHLLVRVLDNIENGGWGLVDRLAAIQPLPSGVGEAESGEVPETGRFVIRVTGCRLEPTGSLGVRDVYATRGIE